MLNLLKFHFEVTGKVSNVLSHSNADPQESCLCKRMIRKIITIKVALYRHKYGSKHSVTMM